MSLDQRFLGGEAGHRTLWGTSVNRTRNIALGVVGVVGLFTVPVMGTTAFLVVGAAALVVFVATLDTARGSLWTRWRTARIWKYRSAHGLKEFIPVAQRPLELHAVRMAGTRAEQRAVAAEWSKYRDLPDGLDGMEWFFSEPRKPGVMYHGPIGEEPWFSVVFPIEGQLAGIQGDAVVNARSRSFGTFLGTLGTATALARRVQMITRVLPVDTAAHEAWVLDNLDEDAPEELVRSYAELVERTGATGGLRQRHYAVVRWPLDKNLLDRARRKAPGREGILRLMGEEIDSVHRAMNRAHLGAGRALSAAQVGAVIRNLQLPSWPLDRAGDIDLDALWVPSRDERSFTTTMGASPSGVEETWFHRTAVVPVKNIETGPRDAQWLMPLLGPLPRQRVIRTVSIQLEGLQQRHARTQARQDLTADLAEVVKSRKQGQVLEGSEVTTSLAAARSRVQDLKPGARYQGVDYLMHVAVSAPTLADLTSACELMEEAAGGAGLNELQWLDGHQGPGLPCTWPVARGMKPVGRSAGMQLNATLAGTGDEEDL